MRNFQGLHVVPQSEAHTGASTASEPQSEPDTCNLCAGPKDEATYLDRIARSRRLYFVIAVGWAFVYIAVELVKGWIS